MPAVIRYPAGTPSWVELSSPDLDASAGFYGELFGWETTGTHTFTKDGAEVAGLVPLEAGERPVWTTYVAVDDVAAGPRVIRDSEGACFKVRQGGAQLVNAPGALTMNELRTRDLDGASSFYGEMFGWEVEPIEVGGRPVYASVKLDGRLVAGMLPSQGGQPHWIPYFGAEDVEVTAQRAGELGGEALSGPVAVPAGRFVALRDPHGAAFMVLEGQYDPPPGA